MEENYSILDRKCRRCKKSPAEYEKVGTWFRRVCQDCRTEYKAEWWQGREQRNAKPNRFAILDRACNKCGTNPAWFEKHPAHSDGYRLACVECVGKMRKAWRALNPISTEDRVSMRKTARDKHSQVRHEVLQAYGGFCFCCGVDDENFLTLDHKFNDGASHRKQENLNPGMDTYKWAKKNGYPPIFQVACFNCNCARQFRNNGVCPHETERLRLIAA